jgi:transcriptional regulator NrdR family protein
MGKEIASTKIWEDVLSILKEEDDIAYVRFASVFMDFESIKDFKKILK